MHTGVDARSADWETFRDVIGIRVHTGNIYGRKTVLKAHTNTHTIYMDARLCSRHTAVDVIAKLRLQMTHSMRAHAHFFAVLHAH